MPKTALPSLSVAEWHTVKELCTTLTGYDPAGSSIKGKKSIEVLQEVQGSMQAEDYVEAQRLIELLIHREAFNTMVGIEGKNRRKAKARGGSAATSAA